MNTHNAPRPLSAQVQSPTRRLLPPGSFVAIGMALAAVGTLAGAVLVGHHLAAGQMRHPTVQVLVMNKPPPGLHAVAPRPAPAPAEPTALPTPATPTVISKPANLPRNSDHALVFALNGHTYVAIDTIPQARPWDEDQTTAKPLPRHGALQIVGEPEFPSGIVASVQTADLDPDIVAWQDHPLLIDGRCAGRVADFALVGLLAGEPLTYTDAGENEGERDRANTLLMLSNAVIAGRVPECALTQGVARSASLPRTVPAVQVTDERLLTLARDRFLSSELAAQAQRDYEASELPGIWWQSELGTLTSQVFRHPATGQTTVSIQAVVDHGCGGADINLWGLYDVDASGQLRQRQLINAGDIIDVSAPIDIDGDGTFEFSAFSGSGESMLLSSEGDVMRRLEVPFYGCSC